MKEQNIHILMVEDQTHYAEFVRLALEDSKDNYHVTVVNTLRKARDIIDENIPDLVIADLLLSDGKGIELLPSDNERPLFPIILMMGHKEDKMAEGAIKARALDHFVKSKELVPIIPYIVERSLREWRHIENFRMAEEELRESKRMLDSIIETVPDIIYRLDTAGNITFISNAVEKYGYSADDLIGINIFSIVHPDDREKASFHINERRTGERSTVSLEVRLFVKNDTYVPFELTFKEIKNEPLFLVSASGLYTSDQAGAKHFSGTQGIARDISIRKEADDALHETEEIYRSMMEAIEDFVYICSPDYRVAYMNPAMIRRIGYDGTGKHCYAVLHGLEERCSWCVHSKIQKGEHTESEVLSPLDGRTYHIVHSPIFHVDGSISKMTIYRDITDLKRAEEGKLARKKLEGVIEMAGAACHELNQPLMVITGNCELLMMKMDKNDPNYERIKVINEQIHKMGVITEKIMKIKRYKTMKYINGEIIDIEEASKYDSVMSEPDATE